jgi:hypothetical protein
MYEDCVYTLRDDYTIQHAVHVSSMPIGTNLLDAIEVLYYLKSIVSNTAEGYV